MIQPHGGKLINQRVGGKEKTEILKRAGDCQTIVLDDELTKDVKNIGRGVYSPLKGFLGRKDFDSVLGNMRLKNGLVWSIPIVLDINEKQAEELKSEKTILLKDQRGNPIAVLENPETYDYDKETFAKNVFGTADQNHPGVDGVFQMKEFLIGGEIKLLDDSREPFSEFNFTPLETREIFRKNGWEKIVAFQTRNVPHCGHEFLQKEALKITDGLFVQPVVGEKKIADFKDEYILASYEVLIDRYYPKDKILLGVLPLKMRYAGPCEAVFHALIRKNFGCSHFIVGRDHAGVGNYYPPFAAQEIFQKFKPEEIGVEILKFPEVVFCPKEEKHIFRDQCPHEEKISFSGTKLRQFILNNQQPPKYLLRPEVYFFLSQSNGSLVDEMYKNKGKTGKKGFVLWLTGFSQSGKTTIADGISRYLENKGIKSERLDGDIVRQYLSADLGFSKEDRDENIRRIGFVSKMMAKSGIPVITSFISPYRGQRDEARQGVEQAGAEFIEIFCHCPIEVCESRDTKGLYEKARRGEIKNFTGVSDPYEEPEKSEIVLRTGTEPIEKCLKKIADYLSEKNLI